MALINVISANLPVLRDMHERMGQLELAERVGVSRRTIARIENAEVSDPGIDLIARIAEELGVSLSFLAEEELQLITLPLPASLCDRLNTEEAPTLLTKIHHHLSGTG
jgi:transcriptional regulator with XRE-family HTH domain